MKVNKAQSFGAHLEFEVGQLAKKSVQDGMSKKYVQAVMKKIDKLFPGKDYFVKYDAYNTRINGDQRDIVYTVAAVEKKNPNDWNPKKSIYKHVIWPKFKEQRSGAVPDNDLIAFYNAIRMLAKKDFSFDRNLPGWDNAEKIWLA